MFTGLVEEVGTIAGIAASGDNHRINIHAPSTARELKEGHSVAVSGVCLTALDITPKSFSADLAKETWTRTSFSRITAGAQVNLELPLKVDGRMGGHIVQGHVDGVGRVRERASRGGAVLLDIEAPVEVSQVSIPLGSVTVDGVSLTVNAMPGTGIIQVSLIPFTFKHTTLGSRMPGDRVHLEGDTIGKYVRSLLEERQRRLGGGGDGEPLEPL